MLRTKRIIIASASGILFGFVCFGFACSGPNALPTPVTLQIIFSRALIGFAIGVSCLSTIHWSLHGLLMGFLFSLPLAFSGLMAPETPEFNAAEMFVATIVMGLLYGFLIELITTVFFKAKIKC